MGNRILFEPLTIRHKVLRNRIVMPPMVTNMGITSKQGVAWYRERARGGVGLVIVEATWLDRFQDPSFVAGLPRLVDAVQREGAAIAIQLFQPARLHGEPVAVTAREGARELTEAQIQQIIEAFAHAARVCREVGFDGVEPHGAHGYLLNQFFSPRFNHRTDAYGGSLAGRMRMGLEVTRAVRKAIGEECVLLYRHTPAEEVAGGYGIEETLAFAKELVAAGVDVLDISPSTSRHGEHCDWAAAVKRSVPVPVIAVGRMREPGLAAAALRAGKCDLVALGRQLIADAWWPNKIREGRQDTIIPCRECNEHCFGHLRQGIPIGCAQNPDSGREYLRAQETAG